MALGHAELVKSIFLLFCRLLKIYECEKEVYYTFVNLGRVYDYMNILNFGMFRSKIDFKYGYEEYNRLCVYNNTKEVCENKGLGVKESFELKIAECIKATLQIKESLASSSHSKV